MNASRTSLSRERSLSAWFGALSLSLAAFGIGCASVAGVKGGAWDGNTEDDETKIRTSLLCLEYCDVVMDSCKDEFAVYQSRAACLNTCNVLEPGDPGAGEPEPNTVLCRLKQAKGAKDSPGELCEGASPGGAGVCGTNCESWCELLESACPDDYAEMNDCLVSCATIPDAGGFDVASGYTANENNLQCRISHLGAALAGAKAAIEHCPHTKLITQGACTGGSGADPITEYCQTVISACPGDDAQYLDLTECETIAFSFPEGLAGSMESQNTLACRTYHAGAALTNPSFHCPHAGPAGDGMCADTAEEGNCESFCLIFESACQDDFEADFGGDDDTCIAECMASSLAGIAPDSKYKYSGATDTDSLGCRIRRAVEAKGAGGTSDAVELCGKARIAPGAFCD